MSVRVGDEIITEEQFGKMDLDTAMDFIYKGMTFTMSLIKGLAKRVQSRYEQQGKLENEIKAFVKSLENSENQRNMTIDILYGRVGIDGLHDYVKSEKNRKEINPMRRWLYYG